MAKRKSLQKMTKEIFNFSNGGGAITKDYVYNALPYPKVKEVIDGKEKLVESFRSTDPEAKPEIKIKLQASSSARTIAGFLDISISEWILLNEIKQGNISVFRTEYDYFVSEYKLPDDMGYVITSLAPELNGENKIESTLVTKDKTLQQEIEILSDKFQRLGILACQYAHAIKLQAESTELEDKTEIIDNLNEVLELGDNYDVAIFKATGSFYYSLLGNDTYDYSDTNNPEDAVRLLDLEISQDKVGAFDEKVLGTYDFEVFTEDTIKEMNENDGSLAFFKLLEKTYCNNVFDADSEEFKNTFEPFDVSDEKTRYALESLVKMFTFSNRHPKLKKPLSMVLRGASGDGKSTLTMLAAKLTNQAYRPVIASSANRFDEADVAAKIIPELNIDDSDLFKAKRGSEIIIPADDDDFNDNFIEAFSDPATVYERITGDEAPEDINPPEVCRLLTEDYVKKTLKKDSKTKENSFAMKLTDIGKTLLYGGVTELQEFNMAEAVKLQASFFNRILQERMLSLPNEMQLPVHPDANLVWTMNNLEYADLPDSFTQRHYKFIEFTGANAKTMSERSINYFESLGYKLENKAEIYNMALYVENAKDELDGADTLSQRALNNWIMACLDGENIFDAARTTVINVATKDLLLQEALLSKLRETELYNTGLSVTEIVDEAL